MAKFKVVHLKEQCISCGACAAICPDRWKMDEQGLADLIGSIRIADHYELIINNEEEAAECQQAADCCPVNVITVEREAVRREIVKVEEVKGEEE